MKRSAAGLLVVLGINISAAMAGGAEPSVMVSHEVTGYDKNGRVTTVQWTLRVVNSGDKPLSGLHLSVVPPRTIPSGRTTVDVGTLAPGEKRDLSFSVKVQTALGKERISREPLFIGAKYLGPDGDTVEMSATSHPGGAK